MQYLRLSGFLVSCLVLLVGCATDPVMRPITLTVTPQDTLHLEPGDPFGYEMTASSGTDMIWGAFTTVHDSFLSKDTLVGPTDNRGHAAYSGRATGDSGLYVLTFAATRSGIGTTPSVSRAIEVRARIVTPPIDTPLAASITARGVMPDGSIVAEPVAPQQTLHTRASVTLLPFVFFDNNSAAINARYYRIGATGFTAQSAMVGKDALDANHFVLDIIGERLKANLSANVRVVGTNSNTGEEKDNINLSKARATAIADYLATTWDIDRSRITVDQRNLPELPTNPVRRAGNEENRRVEISSNVQTITGPVIIENRENLSVGETQIRFDMSVYPGTATHQYSSWQIIIDKDGQQLGPTLSGPGAPPTSTTTTLLDASPYLNQPIHYTLRVTDQAGRSAAADGFTRIVPRTVDRDNLEKFAMISFDFDRADINVRARQMLSLIAESISRDALGVRIDGFCDATGTPEYNQALSEARANSAVTTLRGMTTLPANVTVHGHGLRDPKFSNDLPEGRQLNRRVEFTIDKSVH